MGTPKSAVAALRRINTEEMIKPVNADYDRAVAFDDLSKALSACVRALPQYLKDTYDIKCRQRQIYPIPIECTVLSSFQAGALYWRSHSNARIIRTLKGFKELQEFARDFEVRASLCLRPTGATVICNFIRPGPGRAYVIIL